MFARRSVRRIAHVVATAVVIVFTVLASTSCAADEDPSADVAPVTTPASPRPLPLTSQPVAIPQSRQPVPLTSQPVGAASRVVVIGDSYTGGSDAGGYGDTGWPALVWKRLEEQGIGIAPKVAGLGGSGYVTRGQTGEVFGQEVAKLVTPDDKVVMFFGGMNDGMVPPAEVAAAARSAFESVRQTAPKARLLVIGPAWPNAQRAQVMLNMRDAIEDEALAVGATFVDPLADGWFDNTPPDFIGFDNVHPTNAGHAYMADKIEPYIRAELVKAGVA